MSMISTVAPAVTGLSMFFTNGNVFILNNVSLQLVLMDLGRQIFSMVNTQVLYHCYVGLAGIWFR